MPASVSRHQQKTKKPSFRQAVCSVTARLQPGATCSQGSQLLHCPQQLHLPPVPNTSAEDHNLLPSHRRASAWQQGQAPQHSSGEAVLSSPTVWAPWPIQREDTKGGHMSLQRQFFVSLFLLGSGNACQLCAPKSCPKLKTRLLAMPKCTTTAQDTFTRAYSLLPK